MEPRRDPVRPHYPAPNPYPVQIPQPKPIRVDPFAPLPASLAPVQNPQNMAWPEEVQRNSVVTPDPPKNDVAQTALRKRRVSGTGSGNRRSRVEAYSRPPEPQVSKGPGVSYQRSSAMDDSSAMQVTDPKSFAARARGLPQNGMSPPAEPMAEFEPAPQSAAPKRRESSRRHPLPAYATNEQPPSDQEAQITSVSNGVPIQQSQKANPVTMQQFTNQPALSRDAELPTTQATSVSAPQARSSTRRSSAGAEGSRKEWAPDRSPLQKLEVKLNDISKEEKRARVEKAERRLRASQGNRERRVVSEGAEPAMNRTSSRRASAGNSRKGKGVAEPNDKFEQTMTDTDSTLKHSVAPAYLDDNDKQQRRRNQASPRTPVDPADRSSRNNRSHGTKQQPLESSPVEPDNDPQGGRGVRFHSQGDDKDIPADPESRVAQQSAQNLDISNVHGTEPQELLRQDQMSMGAGASKEVPSQQQALYSGKARRSGRHDDAAAHGGAPDPVPAKAVRAESDTVKYAVPYQTAAGIEARRKVGFGDEPVGIAEAPVSHTHHFSDILHHGRRIAPNNSPQLEPQRHLDEWRQGGTARLTAADIAIDLDDSAEQKAWWEREKVKNSNAAAAGQKTVAYANDSGTESRPFQPPLFLSCGPLLRFTGLKRDKVEPSRLRGHASQSSERIRETWRGSVMIVTVDGQSDYSVAPTLRLFAEPLDLLPPPPQQVDGADDKGLPPEYIDPVAGLPKQSRTGETVYVKPVEDLDPEVDLSRVETDDGLFEKMRTAVVPTSYGKPDPRIAQAQLADSKAKRRFGKRKSGSQTVRGVRLHAERGVTFWRFNLEVELTAQQTRIAYSINHAPSIGFWVPAKGQSMNIMFHSCNGFSMSVNPANFSGPDPLWRDVLNSHQTRPFHVMIGGGDQIYNDAVMTQTQLFQDWLEMKSAHHKHEAPFSPEMQEELESFYLDRYSMWFSQGLFGMANSQIPMVNLWDDHDIIDGFGSYPHHFMSTNVFTGLGAVAFKYYMLFQHQSVPNETSADEPSWLLGAAPGPYINELSRSLYMSLGKNVAFLGLDCRTERTRDMIMSQASYEVAFDRCRREIITGETKHLIVLLGVPIAYPRLVWLENVLTSRIMDPIKAMGRAGLLGGFLNKFDGGVEILDDLDDHWTAKNHKQERKYLIEELQELAAEKSIRITILGGDVHLAAVGQFYSNPKLKIPKDEDHRYMANVISSAIVNTPPPEMMGDVLNKRNKTHHFDHETDENMIPLFTHDVNGKPRNNKRLLPRRNWCSIREYYPGSTPPATPTDAGSFISEEEPPRPGPLQRTLSLTKGDMKPGSLIRRLSGRGPTQDYPPSNEYQNPPPVASSPPPPAEGPFPPPPKRSSAPASEAPGFSSAPLPRPGNFRRRPTNMSIKAIRKGGAADDENEGHISLEHGLDIVINCEVSQKDPAGITVPYRLLIPALKYEGVADVNEDPYRKKSLFERFGTLRGGKRRNPVANNQGQGNWGQSLDSISVTHTPSEASEQQVRRDAGVGRGGAMGLLRSLSQGATGRRRLNKDPPAKQRDDYSYQHEGTLPVQPNDRVEDMSLVNPHPSNPARIGPISAPQPQAQVETTIQGDDLQAQPQHRPSTAGRVEGMSLFPRGGAAASTTTRSQPPPPSQPLSLRTLENRAEQQQQQQQQRPSTAAATTEGYPGRRPSKLDRVLGIGNARGDPQQQQQQQYRAGDSAAVEGEDDYYSDERDEGNESFSEEDEQQHQNQRRSKGYSGIEAYKEQKGWRRFF